MAFCLSSRPAWFLSSSQVLNLFFLNFSMVLVLTEQSSSLKAIPPLPLSCHQNHLLLLVDEEALAENHHQAQTWTCLFLELTQSFLALLASAMYWPLVSTSHQSSLLHSTKTTFQLNLKSKNLFAMKFSIQIQVPSLVQKKKIPLFQLLLSSLPMV